MAGATHTQASGYTPTDARGRVSNPFVIAALVGAVLLLGLAALPLTVIPDPRLAVALAEHRIEVATGGVVALVAAIVAALFS